MDDFTVFIDGNAVLLTSIFHVLLYSILLYMYLNAKILWAAT